MNTTERFEVVAGTRTNPGQVLKVFPAGKAYKCGGPATACLAWFDRAKRQGASAMFFRRVTGAF